MNPRQQRGLLLLVLTALGAVAVFFAVAAFTAEVNSRVGPMASAWQVSRDVEAYEALEAGDLVEVEVPERWLPSTAIAGPEALVGKVAATAIPTDSLLQVGMFTDPPSIAPSFREVAIMVDAETGVAGKVQPGNRVDIIATLPESETQPARAEVWVADALVLEVGLPQETADSDVAGNLSSTSGVPVTFALPAEDALRLAYVESFSEKLRLSLRGAGDDGVLPPDAQTYQEDQG